MKSRVLIKGLLTSIIVMSILAVLCPRATIHQGKSASIDRLMDTSQIGAPPISNNPPDQFHLMGEVGMVIPWIITDPDNSTGYYSVLRNGDLITSLLDPPTWNNDSAINFPVSTVSPGLYNYTIGFVDSIIEGIANGGYDTVWIRVEAPPVINTMDEIRIHTGDANKFFNFSISDTDSLNGTLNVTMNGSLEHGPNATWNESEMISLPINTSTPGWYNYTVLATDGNYTIESETIVWISDNFPPEIDNIKNWTISPDIGILSIVFKIKDSENTTGNYTLYQQGSAYNSSFDNATWTNDTDVDLQFMVTTTGTFEFSIHAEDLSGAQTQITFSIYVNVPPIISPPENATYTHMSENRNLTWIITDPDNSTGTYTVLRNGLAYTTLYINKTWMHGGEINVTAYTNVVGTWNYTIVYDDGISSRQQTTLIIIEPSDAGLEDTTILILIGGFIVAGIIGFGIIISKKK